MVYASGATLSSLTTRTGFTYINSLVTGATAVGINSIIVEGTYMDDNMMTGLTTTYGFNVTPMVDAMSTFKRYRISWG